MAKVALTTTERPQPPREDLEQVVIAAAEAAAQAHLESAAEYHRKAAETLAAGWGSRGSGVRRVRRGGGPAGRQRSGIAADTIPTMAMTLRLTEDETAALRLRARREGRSMQDVARAAVREYIDRESRRELLDNVLDEELPRYAEALRRLGE